MNDLPLEIINLIVDQVAADAPGGSLKAETLRSCALASRSFLYQSQKHLFTEIQFTIDADVRQPATRLAAVYNDNEDLLARLRCLTLVFNMQNSGEYGSDFLYDIGLGGGNAPLETRRMSKICALLKLFARANLESFSIVARNGFLNWSRLSYLSQELLLSIPSPPTLRSIRCERIINLNRELIFRRGLQELALGLNIDIPFHSGNVSVLPATALERLSSLTHLEIDHTALFQFLPPPWRTGSNYMPQLQSLIITLPRDYGSRMDIMDFISHIGKQLQSLHLTSVWYPHPDMAITADEFWGEFSYDDLPNLRHLTLENGPGPSLLSTSFVAFANILAHAYTAKSTSMKVLDIKVELYPAALQNLGQPPRVDIDEVLTNPALVGRLREISVHIIVHRDPHGRPTDALASIHTSEDLRRFFPKTSAQDGLNLKLYLTHV